MKMNIRSITSTGAVLLISTVAGFAEDWPQSPFERPQSPRVPAQSSQAPAQSPQAPAQSPQVPAQSSQNWTQSSQDWTQNLYANVDFGGMFQQNTTLFQSTGTPKTTTFSPGIRGDIALGYNINKSLAVEFDTGVLWNSMDKVGGISLSSANQSADIYTIPVLANIIYKVPLKDSWHPYVGVGVGGAAAIISYSIGASSGGPLPISTTPTTLGDYNFVFAYQAEVGLEYELSKNASIGIAYEFFGTSDPRWYFSQIPSHLKEGGYYTHSFTVSFTWNF
jgi:opacity protein-like surface antigen